MYRLNIRNHCKKKKSRKHSYLLFLTTTILTFIPYQIFTQDTAKIYVHPGWNMISLPLEVPDGSKQILFPSATSNAFTYQNGYVRCDNLIPGVGYWLKFAQVETVKIVGTFKYEDTISLYSRWNMIGSFSVPISIDSVGSDPPNIIKSDYYHYSPDSGYKKTTILELCKAYWVKASKAGKLIRYCWVNPEEVLIEPPNNSIGKSYSITMKWRRSPCAKSYHLQVTTDTMFNHLSINDSTVVDTTYYAEGFDYGTVYYWRVGMHLQSGEIFWSSTWKFETMWKSLGLDGLTALDMVISWPELYVCAGKDGLWRYDLNGTDTVWEYLGLADTSGLYPPKHVVSDVDVYNDTLLVAMYHLRDRVPYQDTGIWRSNDKGITWQRSDSGMHTPDWPYSSMWTVKRSPDFPSTVVASVGAHFRSSNGGYLWQQVWPDWGRDVETFVQNISWHPKIVNKVWIYGMDNLFGPAIAFSNDGGFTWDVPCTDSMNFGGDTQVYGLAFDPVDTNVMYLSCEYGILKSTASGADWCRMHWEDQPWILRGSFRRIASHTIISGEAYFAAPNKIFITRDAGTAFEERTSPVSPELWSLLFCKELDALVIGTFSGVYLCKLNR